MVLHPRMRSYIGLVIFSLSYKLGCSETRTDTSGGLKTGSLEGTLQVCGATVFLLHYYVLDNMVVDMVELWEVGYYMGRVYNPAIG